MNILSSTLVNQADFDVMEIALMASVEGSRRPDAPVRAFGGNIFSRSYPVGRGDVPRSEVSAAPGTHEGVTGVMLIRRPGAFSGGTHDQEIWFVPYSAFGSVREVLDNAVRVTK
jgi:hypothetical protein